MSAIQDIFTTYGPEYIEKFGGAMPEQHKKVIDAITNCRTAANGTVIYECTECGKTHETFRSCGNRHCPVCQNHKTRQWLEKQLERQVPGHHFMITVTVPESLRPFMRSHQQISYSALFKSSSDAIKNTSFQRAKSHLKNSTKEFDGGVFSFVEKFDFGCMISPLVITVCLCFIKKTGRFFTPLPFCF